MSKQRKPLLPREELDAIVAAWQNSHNEPTITECLEMWRKEWYMSWCVYGDTVAKQKKGSNLRQGAEQALAKRMVVLIRIGEMLKEARGRGQQQKMEL